MLHVQRNLYALLLYRVVDSKVWIADRRSAIHTLLSTTQAPQARAIKQNVILRQQTVSPLLQFAEEILLNHMEITSLPKWLWLA